MTALLMRWHLRSKLQSKTMLIDYISKNQPLWVQASSPPAFFRRASCHLDQKLWR
ncbi:hypothetical protein M378DRAFT_160743 [Amanita muscaria Koide BX008]|uniref:Uncharacterized protein n=1 Tax=Amanita muscaria (strain Koide BX008) TaxID=946122 RepID=A0A0C2THD1_AMAMK|nr:hypothetical protein M378DRAFT_160743 [Amanita muscaria Koide BX008]